MATKTANRVAAEVLNVESSTCSDIVLIEYNSEQIVSAIRTNTAAINSVRTAMTDAVMSAIEDVDSLSVAIPVGTLTGFRFLSGWGPLVEFPMSFTPTVLSDVSSSLVSTGMNQSAFRVVVHLDISLYVITPGGRSSVGTRVSYPFAEAVILGEVPNNLTEVYGDDQSTIGQIFDYGTAE